MTDPTCCPFQSAWASDESAPAGCRLNTPAAVPPHSSASDQPVSRCSPYPTWWPPDMPLANDRSNPGGWRSTALAAVPDHNVAWIFSKLPSDDEKPTCLPPEVPTAADSTTPKGFKST